jgi:subtilase family serine protease
MRGSSSRLFALLTAFVATVGAAIASAGPAATASSPRLRVGSVPRLPHGARVGSAVPSGQQLHLTIALAPRNAAALHALATAASTPGSSQFRHYLTVDQFAQRFGATSAQISAVSNGLRAQGLSVGSPTANDLTIPVTGTVARVEKAFSVSESQVSLPGGRVAYANNQPPVLRSDIARNVQGVIGLDDVTIPQAQGLRRSRTAGARQLRRARTAPASQAVGNGPAPCSGATNAAQPGGYTADEVASAYGMGAYYSGDEGAGQTVALVEFGPYQPSDVGMFQSCYPGTTGTVTNVNVDGGPGTYTSGTDDDSEQTLDIDQVMGLAPQANLVVYQGPATGNQADALTAIASQDVAQVVSSSWGACERLTGQSVISSENTTLQEMAAQGQSFFISSGDTGSTSCYQTTRQTPSQDNSLSVIDPGGQPFATGVGGTFMGHADQSVPTDGSYPGEYVWNDGGADASGDDASGTGGGLSSVFAMPGYQSGAASSLGVLQSGSSRACGGQLCRQVPDVSADSDPNSGYVVYSNGGANGGGWAAIGGTSAAAPLWAAFTALANASPACAGTTLGFENPSLYLVAGRAYAPNFHDITQPSPFTNVANNDTWVGANPNNPSGLYPVLPGYDMATGLGSPIANALGTSLCHVHSVTVTSPGNQTTIMGTPVLLVTHGADSGNLGLAYSATGLPAGVTMSSGGVISGRPTTAQTATVTITATDAYTNTGSTSFTWTVVAPQPPTERSVKLSGLGKGKPRLTFTVASGSFAPALRSVTIKLPGGLSFARKAKSLGKGVSVKTGSKKVKFTPKLAKGALTITFKAAVTTASVTIAAPAINISAAEAARVRKHKVRKLTIGLKATDTARKVTSFGVALKKLS